jgi:hypothetical protein
MMQQSLPSPILQQQQQQHPFMYPYQTQNYMFHTSPTSLQPHHIPSITPTASPITSVSTRAASPVGGAFSLESGDQKLETARQVLKAMQLKPNIRQQLNLLLQRQHLEEQELRWRHFIELEKFHKNLAEDVEDVTGLMSQMSLSNQQQLYYQQQLAIPLQQVQQQMNSKIPQQQSQQSQPQQQQQQSMNVQQGMQQPSQIHLNQQMMMQQQNQQSQATVAAGSAQQVVQVQQQQQQQPAQLNTFNNNVPYFAPQSQTSQQEYQISNENTDGNGLQNS